MSDPASRNVPQPFPPGPTLRVLRHVRVHLPPDHFAVVDGARFDNAAATFMQAGLSCRPVFLEAGDADAVSSGPFLVPLDNAEQIQKLIAVIGDGRAPVIWSWQHGEPALYRHLRTLNAVLIPTEPSIDDDAAHEAEWVGMEADGVSMVLFRHWDPDVLGALQPHWRPGQISRVLGPSGVIAFLPSGSDVTVLHAGAQAQSPESGVLTFTRAQTEQLSRERLHRSRAAIMDYLRETAAEELAGTDDNQLYAIVSEAEASGNAVGLTSEHAHGLWAYLHVLTGGETSRSADVRQHFYKAAEDPETVLRQVLDEVLAELDDGAA